jgi:hypothetical protein
VGRENVRVEAGVPGVPGGEKAPYCRPGMARCKGCHAMGDASRGLTGRLLLKRKTRQAVGKRGGERSPKPSTRADKGEARSTADGVDKGGVDE